MSTQTLTINGRPIKYGCALTVFCHDVEIKAFFVHSVSKTSPTEWRVTGADVVGDTVILNVREGEGYADRGIVRGAVRIHHLRGSGLIGATRVA